MALLPSLYTNTPLKKENKGPPLSTLLHVSFERGMTFLFSSEKGKAVQPHQLRFDKKASSQ